MGILADVIAASSASGLYMDEDEDPYVYLSWWEYPDLASTADDRITNIHFMSIPPESGGDSQARRPPPPTPTLPRVPRRAHTHGRAQGCSRG